MRYSITLFIDKAEEMLREVSPIADLSNDGIANYTHAIEMWLVRAEQLFKEYNQGEQALLAAIIPSVKLAGSAGAIDENDSASGRRKKRKRLLAEHLNQSVDYFYRAYAREKAKVEEASELVRQVILVALQNGVLNEVLAQNKLGSDQLVNIQALLYADVELRKGLNQVLAIVAYPDLLRLIDNTLTNILSRVAN